MLPKKPQYNFYPSLLNEYQMYRDEVCFGDNPPAVDKERLLAKINRIKEPPTEAMAKGNAFEKCLAGPGIYSADGFDFDPEIVDPMFKVTEGGIWQQFVKFKMDHGAFLVEHYGYIDVIKRNMTIDVKTGAQYQFPKFQVSYQHKVYLIGANSMGGNLDRHLFLITDFREVYKEEYMFQPLKFTQDLRAVSNDLVNFIELHRDKITDKRIFNKQYEQDKK